MYYTIQGNNIVPHNILGYYWKVNLPIYFYIENSTNKIVDEIVKLRYSDTVYIIKSNGCKYLDLDSAKKAVELLYPTYEYTTSTPVYPELGKWVWPYWYNNIPTYKY